MKWEHFDIRELSDREYQKWYSLMGEERQRRVDRFCFVDDKKRTVAGEMLARTIIAKWCNISPETIMFDVGEHGKPFAVGLDIHFNISHSGNMVVCAVNDKPVGIDIAQIRPIDSKVCKRFCNNDDLIYIFGSTDIGTMRLTPEINKRLFEIWTQKEACCKCIGTGITDINSVNFGDFNITKYRIDDYIISIAIIK